MISLAAVCIWSLIRSVVVAGMAAFLAQSLAPEFVGQIEAPAKTRRTHFWFCARWVLLLAPFLAPPLLVGYAYHRPAVWLLNYPKWNEAIYWLLLLLKFLPVAVVLHVFAPPAPLSPEAMHAEQLLRVRHESFLSRTIRFLASVIWGPTRAAIAAFAIVFLLAFQEFEIASLMGITAGEQHSPISWTVWLFDAHAGGLPLADSLKLALTPMLFELLVILPAVAVLPAWLASAWQLRGEGSAHPRFQVFNRGLLIVSALVLAGAPTAVVVRGAAEGLAHLNTHLPVLREIVIAGGIALGVTVLAGALAHSVLRENVGHGGRSLLVTVLCLPGLLGSLVLSLLILGLFQLPGFRSLGESLVPLMLSLVLFVLPRVLVLFAVIGIGRRTQNAHSAWMLAQSPLAGQRRAAARLIDDLEFKSLFWSAVLVLYWTYWEMTPPALLAPPSVIPFSVLLYNFMHYGQNAALSTMLLSAVVLPIAVIVVLALFRPHLVRLVLR